MHFDDNDTFLGGEIIEDAAEIVQHNYWRDAMAGMEFAVQRQQGRKVGL